MITKKDVSRSKLLNVLVLIITGLTTSAARGDTHVDGQWGDILDWPLVAVSMANLPDGRILTYSGSERRTWPSTERTFSATWDPLTQQFDETVHLGHNMFCGAMSMTEDGQVFVNGGRNQSNSRWTSLYDYQTGNWNLTENMASGGRWYPTTLALGNGNILTAMGVSTNVRNPDLWSSDNGWRILNGIDFLSLRQRRNQNGRENVFPLLSQAPNGDVYHFWDTVENHYISTIGNGDARRANPDTDHSDHAGGVQVMYDEGKLLITGNNDGSWGGNSSAVTSNAFTVDLNGAAPVIRDAQSMNFSRKFHQMIPFPTGEVFVVGGNTTGSKFQDNGSVLQTEIWNPQSGTWRLAASMSVPRDYHSTALLMIDGRVITAGGGYHPSNPSSGGTHQDAQIYSPPYLFSADGQLAARPTVQADFTEVGYGQSLSVSTSGDIGYFSLIKMSATTHAINTDTRFFKPSFNQISNGRYAITMHDNPNVATPGYWMLFAVDSSGVPSIAQIIQITSEPTDPNNGSAPVISEIVSTPVETAQFTQFSVTAAGIGLVYRWNFGDGTGDTTFSALTTISHSFSLPGRYVVSVTARTPGGVTASRTFTQLVHSPLTASRPTQSGGMAEITTRNELWSVNPDNNSVGVLNTTSLSRVAVVNVGDNPRALALAPDGDIWVTNKDSATISVVDATSRTIRQTINLPVASQPHGVVFANGRAYVALEALGVVLQLNTINGNELRRVTAGNFPRHLSVNAAADRLYVSSFITPPLPGESGRNPSVSGQGGQVRVFNISASSLAAGRTILLSHINRDVSEHEGPGIPNYLGPTAISPDGLTAWVPSKQDNILSGALRGPFGMTFDQTVRAVTSMVDLESETEVLSARVDHDNASVASHAAFDVYGLTLFTSLEGNRQVAVIDTGTQLEVARFDTGMAPQSLLLSEAGDKLYVHNFMDRTVGVYDVSAIINQGSTSAEQLAIVRTSVGERLPNNVLRGKQLFYDARDDRLAALDYMSCASCHNEGGHDGRTWDIGGLGEGLRNTISLKGTGGTDHGLLHWSANFDEVQDFEAQIRQFAGGTGLMSNAQFLAGTRSEPLGDSKAGISNDLDALAAYVNSLDTVPPSPYRSVSGNLTSLAENGRAAFIDLDCGSCHAGDRFTDSTTSPLLHDIGTLDQDSGNRLNAALIGIDTPTLLGAWKSAPYLHDGSASSIRDAILAHSNISISADQASSLEQYVLQIDSRETAPEPPPSTEQCNLIDNGSFDDNTAGWSTNTTLETISDSQSGTGAMAFGNGWASTVISASGNTRYTISGYGKSPAGSGWAGLGVDFLDGAGNEIGELVYSLRPIGNYTPFSLEDITPTNTAFLRMWIYASSTRSVNIDEVDIRPTGCTGSGGGFNQPPTISSPGNQSNNTGDTVNLPITAMDREGALLQFSASNLPAGLQIDSESGVISGSPITVGQSQVVVRVSDGNAQTETRFSWSIVPEGTTVEACNLIPNGRFESDVSDWYTNTSLTTTSDASEGAQALQFTAGSVSVTVPAQAGTNYIFTGMYKSTAESGWSGYGIDYLNANQEEIAEEVLTLPATQAYATTELSGTVPASVSYMRLWIYTPPTRTLVLDDLLLRDVSCGI